MGTQKEEKDEEKEGGNNDSHLLFSRTMYPYRYSGGKEEEVREYKRREGQETSNLLLQMKDGSNTHTYNQVYAVERSHTSCEE